MSLPSSFDDAPSYFVAAVDFLHTHSWIYRDPNTQVLNAIDCMPAHFQDYFMQLSNEQMNSFPFVHEPLSGPRNAAVLHYRQQLAALTPTTAVACQVNDVGKRRRRMSPKKQHEIDKLAAHIHARCADVALLVDLGAGLGYLGEALHELNSNYRILGLEADAQRVEAARERCRQLMPAAAASNSISYQQAYINVETRGLIERYAADLAGSHEQRTTIALIGLHACADLSISAMLLFLAMPGVQSLHIMPCCYHKMALADTSASFLNFPLSAALRSALPLDAASVPLNRPFLRLACQQTSARWRECSAEQHAEHGRRTFLRALADAVHCKNDELVKMKPKCKLSPNVGAQTLTFGELQQSCQLQSQHTGQPLDWGSGHEERFAGIIAHYPNGPRLAEALTCLQTAMQKLCENVVLMDRLCYLEEAAAAARVRLKARYEKLLDEKLSPRCFVLIAEKLT